MVHALTTSLTLSAAVGAGRDQRRLNHTQPFEDQDMQLVRRIAAGEDAAFRALYTAYGQRLFAYAVRLTRNPTIAKDVVQESLVAVWLNASRFRGDGRVIAWLLGIVHHKALHALRRQSPAGLDEEAEEWPDEGATLDEQMAGRERAELLREGLDALSLKHRVVLELVFYQGLNLAEVAEVCDCPIGTVKSRLNYAKAHLRRVLERAGMQAEDVQP